eukprot:scpid85779/ scgid18760/ Phospholipase A2 isozyme S11-61; ASPLA9; Phosphatidylcholine 2-acylhydrolase
MAKRTGVFILCMLVAAMFCTGDVSGSSVAAGSSAMEVKSRSKRSLLNFGGMISCVIPQAGNAITAAIRYTNYGCWCGVGGSGPVADEIDACCKVHDACYDEAIASGCSDPKFDNYHWNCDGGDPSCRSTWWQKLFGGGNNSCEKKICKCDQQAVDCFHRHNGVYDSSNIAYIDRSHCK